MLDVDIASQNDWVKFDHERLRTIIDPMVFRVADIFLKGNSVSTADHHAWREYQAALEGTTFREDRAATELKLRRVLSENMGSLFAFFDAIILEDRLPLIDFGATFDRMLGFGWAAHDDLPLIRMCNDIAENKILFNVHVHDDAYTKAKDSALKTMDERPKYSHHMIREVASELTALGFEWRPNLNNISAENDHEKTLARFQLLGLLFNEYAQQTNSKQIIPPRQSQLELALVLPTPVTEARAVRQEVEKGLFTRLTEIANESVSGIQRTIEMPSAPTFLPYLLGRDESSTREGLLRSALKLRNDRLVAEYRNWWRETSRELDRGRIGIHHEKEVARLASAIRRHIDPMDNASVKPKLQLKNLMVAVSVESKIYYNQIWGWVTRQLPGYRYRKLLMDLVISERESQRIEEHIRQLWAKTK